MMLSREMAVEGLYPAVHPIGSSSVLLDPRIVGHEHVQVGRDVRRTLEQCRELRDVISLLGAHSEQRQ
jgi:F-type H+-transporting ATPase subunit beta